MGVVELVELVAKQFVANLMEHKLVNVQFVVKINIQIYIKLMVNM